MCRNWLGTEQSCTGNSVETFSDLQFDILSESTENYVLLTKQKPEWSWDDAFFTTFRLINRSRNMKYTLKSEAEVD